MLLIRQKITILDMQCTDCEYAIEEALQPLPGILEAKADFATETLTLEFDKDVIDPRTIYAKLKLAGYTCAEFSSKKPASLLKKFTYISIALLGVFFLFQLDNYVDFGIGIGELEQSISYGLLFLVGVLTSFHCIGMCGAFVLSYTAATARQGRTAHLSHLAYGLGKTLSYTIFGAFFGLLGGSLTFTLGMRSLVSGAAGLFLIMYGLSMLEVFAGLRRFHLRLPKPMVQFISLIRRRISNPFAIGLLNGLMIACGPLQAMYILAAGTGSPLEGAKLLFIFALGTLPVMVAFGYLANIITANTTRKLLQTSGIIILTLGTIMLNRSLLIAGTGYDFNSIKTKISQQMQDHFLTGHDTSDADSILQNGYQVIYMEVENLKFLPNKFTLRKNIPVKWIINAKKLSDCSRTIIIPSMDINISLHPGLQIVKFNPEESSVISWSCEMGMISGEFVIED